MAATRHPRPATFTRNLALLIQQATREGYDLVFTHASAFSATFLVYTEGHHLREGEAYRTLRPSWCSLSTHNTCGGHQKTFGEYHFFAMC